MVLNSAVVFIVLGAVACFVAVFIVLAPDNQLELEDVPAQIPLAPDGEPDQFDEYGMLQTGDSGDSAMHALENLREGLQHSLGGKLDKSDRGNKLADSLTRADIKLRPLEWIILSVAVSIAVGLVLWMRFGNIVFLAIGAAVGYVGAQIFLKFRKSGRAKAFDAQLAPTILAMSGAIKAGYTFAQAIDLVSKNSSPPMSTELLRVTRQVALGVPIVEALQKMVVRTQSEDVRLMVTAVQIQQQVGGNLAHILDTIETTVRERIRIKGEIQTLTGQARASGWVLIILPFALAGLLSMIAPTYFTPMFSNVIGQFMLGFSGAMVLMGYALIRKIVNIKV